AASAAGGAPQASRIGSLVAETIVLVNPARKYAQFLLRTLLPMVLHVVIALAAGYAVGSEFHRRSMRTWLACAGGNPIVALAGKLAPLFAVFVGLMLLLPLILEGLLGISFRGHAPMVIIAAMLLIVGYLALGALMQVLVRDLATGLGLTGLIVWPAFGYAGVGFPILGMNAFALFWGALLPLRWYMAVLLGQAARGLPLYDSARPFAVLAGLAALSTLLVLLRLRAIAASTSPIAPEAEPAAPSARRGVGGAFLAEWQRVLAIRGAFMLLVLAPLVYGVYYPQPYLNQVLPKVPIPVESASRRGRSATCSRARPCRSRSLPMPRICPYSDRWRTALPSPSIRSPPSSQPAARAPTAASSRRRSPRRARPRSCCSRSSTRSAATRATSCRRPSC